MEEQRAAGEVVARLQNERTGSRRQRLDLEHCIMGRRRAGDPKRKTILKNGLTLTLCLFCVRERLLEQGPFSVVILSDVSIAVM